MAVLSFFDPPHLGEHVEVQLPAGEPMGLTSRVLVRGTIVSE